MTCAPRKTFAVGLIVAENGRLLLQHRDDKPGLPGRNLWGFFGGHVEPGESPAGAFLRELDEELGWRPRHFEHFTSDRVDRDGWHAISHAYAAHLDAPLDALRLAEGQAMALWPPDALPPDAVPGIVSVVERFAASKAYARVRRRWDVITATALLVDPNGRFLLQHRDDKPGIANPGMWGSFGGEVEPYETPHDGFLRELREELGWTPASFDLYGAYPYDAGRQLIYVFTARIDAPLDALTLGEGQGMAFFGADTLPERTVPDLRRLIERFAATETYTVLRAAPASHEDSSPL